MSNANMLMPNVYWPTYGHIHYAHVESSLIPGLESHNLAWAPSHPIYLLLDGPVNKYAKELTYKLWQVENGKDLRVDGVLQGHFQPLQVWSISAIWQAINPFVVYESAGPDLWKYLTEQQKVFLASQSAVLVRTCDVSTVSEPQASLLKFNMAQPVGLQGLPVPCGEQSGVSTLMKLPPGTSFAYFDVSNKSSYDDKTVGPPPLRVYRNGELIWITRKIGPPYVTSFRELRQIDNIDDIFDIRKTINDRSSAFIVPKEFPPLSKDQENILFAEGSHLVMETDIGTEIHRRLREREEHIQHASSAASINKPATA